VENVLWAAVLAFAAALAAGWLLWGRRTTLAVQDEQQHRRLDEFQRLLDGMRVSFEQIHRTLEEQKAVVHKLDERTSSLSAHAGNHGQSLAALTSLSERDLRVQDELKRKVEDAQKLLNAIRTDYEARKEDEKRTGEAIRQLRDKMIGSQDKGEAGENYVADALGVLPPEMLTRNFTVRGKTVEFAIPLNGRMLPLDVKTGMSFKKDVEDVKKYIDPAHTLPYALMAVPDAVYQSTRGEHHRTFKEGVRVLPFSMVLPFVLTLLELEGRSARRVDVQILHQRVGDMARLIGELSGKLESHVSRAITQMQNGVNECRDLVAKLQGNVMMLESLEQTSPPDKGDAAVPSP
jgi:hypothetical protein